MTYATSKNSLTAHSQTNFFRSAPSSLSTDRADALSYLFGIAWQHRIQQRHCRKDSGRPCRATGWLFVPPGPGDVPRGEPLTYPPFLGVESRVPLDAALPDSLRADVGFLVVLLLVGKKIV